MLIFTTATFLQIFEVGKGNKSTLLDENAIWLKQYKQTSKYAEGWKDVACLLPSIGQSFVFGSNGAREDSPIPPSTYNLFAGE